MLMHKSRRAFGSRPALCIFVPAGRTSHYSLRISYGDRPLLPRLRSEPYVPGVTQAGFSGGFSGKCRDYAFASFGYRNSCPDGCQICKIRDILPYTDGERNSLDYDGHLFAIWDTPKFCVTVQTAGGVDRNFARQACW